MPDVFYEAERPQGTLRIVRFATLTPLHRSMRPRPQERTFEKVCTVRFTCVLISCHLIATALRNARFSHCVPAVVQSLNMARGIQEEARLEALVTQ